MIKGLSRKHQTKKALIDESIDPDLITYTQEDKMKELIKALKQKAPLEMETYFDK
jgi:hypothetical protein